MENEEKLCLLFSRLTLNKKVLKSISEVLRTPIDFSLLIALANHHRIMPLMCYHITRHQFDFPEWVKKTFRQSFANHRKRNLLLIKDVQRLCNIASKRNFRLICLKGVALAKELYPDPAIRPMSDADLYIPREQLKVSEQLLMKLGYSHETALKFIHKKEVPRWNRYKEMMECRHLTFYKPMELPYKNYLCMELHTSLYQRANESFIEPYAKAFLKSRPFSNHSSEMFTLSYASQFVYLCTHVYYNAIDLWANFKNTAFRLLHFCDIREMLLRKKFHLPFADYPEKIQEAILFVLKAIFLIYGESYFPQLISYKIDSRFSLPLKWKIGNRQYSQMVHKPFFSRLFSLTPLEDATMIYSKVHDLRNNEFFKKIHRVESLVSGKKSLSCRR